MKIYPLEKLSEYLNGSNMDYEEATIEKIKFYKSFLGGYYDIESDLIGHIDVFYIKSEDVLKGDFAFKLPDDINVTGIPFNSILVIKKTSSIDIESMGVFKINDEYIIGKKKIKNNKLILHTNHASNDIELDKINYIECGKIIQSILEF